MKAAKEMAAQVLVRDLPFGNMDVDNDPPSLNAKIFHFDKSLCSCRRTVSPKNLPSHQNRVLPSENPEPNTVDCWMIEYWVKEDILRGVDFTFFMRPRPSRSGL